MSDGGTVTPPRFLAGATVLLGLIGANLAMFALAAYGAYTLAQAIL